MEREFYISPSINEIHWYFYKVYLCYNLILLKEKLSSNDLEDIYQKMKIHFQ